MTTELAALAGRPILDISTATTIGEVDRAVLDPEAGRITAFQLAKTSGEATVLPWAAIKAIGPDAITVTSSSILRGAEGRAEQRAGDQGLDPLGARALSSSGTELGKVTGLDIDEETGRVERIATTSGDHPGEAIVGIGGYAVIIDVGA